MIFPATVLAERVELLYTGSLRGELEPCGCTAEGDLGGIRRLASALDSVRAASDHPAFLIGTGGLFGSHLASHEIANSFIRSGLQAQGYDAIALQWADLLYGDSFVEQAGLPWVASNWLESDSLPMSPRIIVDRGGLRLGVVGWLSPSQSPYRAKPRSQWRVHGDAPRLAVLLAELRAEVDLLVLVVDRSLGGEPGPPLDGVDVVLQPLEVEAFAEPYASGSTIVLGAGKRGQMLGRATLERRASGSGWRVHASQIIRLTDGIDDAARMDTWYAAYEQALRDDYERQASRPAQTGDFVGSEACFGCHAEAQLRWKETPHASAHDSLVRVGKQFDPNCVVCHVVGYGQPGGFRDAERSAHLRNVGCEACHGGGRRHVSTYAVAPMSISPVGTEGCGVCHTARNSPGFEPDKGMAIIRHWR